jgi:hypothetical protein
MRAMSRVADGTCSSKEPAMRLTKILAAAVVWLSLGPTTAGAETEVIFAATAKQAFDHYWYTQGAEISHFELDQARYGEMHKGHAVLIFVTEPMNPRLQVKADAARPDNTPMLKLNLVRNFLTGIYPYSVMTSIFTPLDRKDHPLPLKISFSSQEWCGNVFVQLNLGPDGYRVQERSYFESEADRDFALAPVISEDALWNLIRTAPQTLPVGRFEMIRGTFESRLTHTPLKVETVTAELSPANGKSLEGAALVSYALHYEGNGRELSITFGRDFPHRIEAWEETQNSGAQFGDQRLTSRAKRTHSLMLDYWNRHRPEDRQLRRQLGLAIE